MGCADNIFRLYAGEITTKRVTVIQPKDKVTDPDVPTDLTGTEVVITCKESTSQSNAEAVAQVSQSVHVDAINGITDLVFDLTNVSNRIKNEGCLLVCDAWIINDAGQRLPQGVFEGEVIASPNKAQGVIDPEDPTISVDDDTLTVNGDIDTQGSIVLTGTLTAAGDISTSGDLDVVNVNASGTVTAGGDISSGGSITATGDISGDDFNASGSITSGGDITATGDIQANSITVSGDGNVGGKISTDGCVEAGCLALDDQTTDPTLAGTGKSAIWQSDGTGSGDDGDIMATVFNSAGGSITRTLVDFDKPDLAVSDIQGYYSLLTGFYFGGTATETEITEDNVNTWVDVLIDTHPAGTFDYRPTAMKAADSVGITGDGSEGSPIIFNLEGLTIRSSANFRSSMSFEPDVDESILETRLLFNRHSGTTPSDDFAIEEVTLNMTQGADIEYAAEPMLSFFVGDTIDTNGVGDAGKCRFQIKASVEGTLRVRALTWYIQS